MARLAWRRPAGAPSARFAVVLPDGPRRGGWSVDDALTFAVGFPGDPADLAVRVVDASGEAAALPLARPFRLPRAPRARLTRLALLERESHEPVLQSVIVPFRDLAAQNPALDVGRLRRVELLFEGLSGAVYLDDVALARGVPPPP